MGHPAVKAENATPRIDTAALVKRAQDSDMSAFAELMAGTKTKLFRFFLYLTRNSELAEDLCQDTYIQAFENLHKLKEPDRFAAWLTTIGRNLFLAHVRAHKNTRTISTDTVPEPEPDKQASPGLSFDLQRALARLDPDDRTLILLVDHQEYSYEEAAKIAGISATTLRSRLQRARQQFSTAFQKG
jgi:RNA polymerase sigma-70 factor (ECF subfamily)